MQVLYHLRTLIVSDFKHETIVTQSEKKIRAKYGVNITSIKFYNAAFDFKQKICHQVLFTVLGTGIILTLQNNIILKEFRYEADFPQENIQSTALSIQSASNSSVKF